MDLHVQKSTLNGSVAIPGSKSHTIRAVAIASLAEGTSRIEGALQSSDAEAAIETYSSLGAKIDGTGTSWTVEGTGGILKAAKDTIDVGNSGTTIRLAMGSCALLHQGSVILTGDEQIQRRPAEPLAQSLNDLGATVSDLNGTGCPPFSVQGRIRGGETSIEAKTSQYLSSLLMCTPLAEKETIIKVPLLNEAPYVGITLNWLDRQGIKVQFKEDYSEFIVPGQQTYSPVKRRIPADFSSATFFLAAGALPGNSIESIGLDMDDTQGDKAVVQYLEAMGATITIEDDRITVDSATLQGCELDMNATPDALPMMAALACFAEGETRLVNVPQARIKETDRIAVMHEELTKLGADTEELPDGLIIRESKLTGSSVDGHGDHRVIMSLAIAGSAIEGDTIIRGADAMAVTYPEFANDLHMLGGNIDMLESPLPSK
jgi:3-phosphoshikimate 1-carboxyvinyltransferase